LEIIVADGLSEDGTRDILKRLAAENPELRIVDNPRRITPCAMNAGIREARGEYLAIMGAHNRYAPDYLRQSVQILEETNADNVGGSMMCEGYSHVQRAIALAHHSPFSVGGARWHNPDYEGPADTVFGGVYRRKIFERIGLFDEELVRNQDDEFNLRLIQSGGRIWQSPRIRSWYSPRQSLAALFRQYLQYGYWRVRVIQKRKAAASLRQFVPGLFVFLLIALPLAGFWWQLATWAWTGLVVAYLVSSVAVSVTIAAREGSRFLYTLPVVFACYHFGYGIGLLRGVLDFVLLKRSPTKFYSSLTRSGPSSNRFDVL
jgi:glycosyltransferase involved in cell wall biosynthesis